MGLFKGFVTIHFIASKNTKSQNTYKQGLYGVNEKRNAAPARYPLALQIPSSSGLTKFSDN